MNWEENTEAIYEIFSSTSLLSDQNTTQAKKQTADLSSRANWWGRSSKCRKVVWRSKNARGTFQFHNVKKQSLVVLRQDVWTTDWCRFFDRKIVFQLFFSPHILTLLFKYSVNRVRFFGKMVNWNYAIWFLWGWQKTQFSVQHSVIQQPNGFPSIS